MEADKNLDIVLAYADLGHVTLNPAGSVHYRSTSLNALHTLRYKDTNPWSTFARLGVGAMQTSSALPVEQNHHYQAVTGAGLQYRLNDRLSLRLEYTRYDADASQAALSLQYRFMRKSHNDQSTAILSKDSSGTALLLVNYPDASIASATTQNPSIEPQEITPPPLPALALPMFYFDINKTTLKAHEKDKLTPLVDWLNSTNEPVVHIIGHTDSTGTKAYNQKLSEQRAEAVQQILIKMGSDRACLQIMGLGESRPAASNATPSGRQQNRRVELTFELPR